MNLWQRLTAVFRDRPTRDRVYISSSQAGVTVNEDTSLTYSAWWACVRVISQTVAALPWGVYQKTAAGREEMDGMVGWLLNNQPNPEMTAFSFREALMAHVLTWGNGYAEIVKDLAGRPAQLWLLAPDRVFPERDEAGALRYRVTGADASTTYLTPDRVLHIHGLGFDGVMGYSPVRMAARSIGVGIAQETFAQAFYGNGAAFGTIVELPVKSLSPEQIAEAERALNDKGRGPAKAFSTKVVPQGSKPHNITMPLQDAQFLESRKFSVTEVCRWFGVPPHKVADLERSTNNNIEHQGIEFVTDAIVPWCIRLEQEANVKLIGYRAQGRVYTKLCVTGLMRGDSKARAEFYRIMTQIGAMSVNEVRALEELNGVGVAGDSHLVQLNQTTLEWLVENPGSKAAPAAPAKDMPGDGMDDDMPAKPTNVIRAEALSWYRQQRKQS
jgi:HK97 family phage portal protein